MTLSPGAQLGPYEIVAPLGAGGMGEVYRARDTRLGREVAVKVLPVEVAENPERLRRFEQEARAASALNHSNILTVHDVGAEGGTSYLVTELLQGESLRELLRRGPLAPKRAVELTVQIAKGLAAAHMKGIVHRDLKPENLFLTHDGVVKILDFGLARVAPPTSSASELARAPTVEALTGEGTVLGTVGYMSPEQVRGEPADARSDLFSLGCVLVEMLTGRRAFDGESAVDTMHAILHAEPASSELLGTLPPAMSALLARCLEKRRERRFQSATDLAFALEHVESTPSSPAMSLTPGASPRRRDWIALGALLLLIALTAAWFVRRPSQDRAVSDAPTGFDRIAVLPFEFPDDAREELAPIADGLAQALINDLSRLPGLRVTPWVTARRYSAAQISPTKLAADLGAQALLTARFRLQRQSLVVSMELLEGDTGLQVWGDEATAAPDDPVALRSLLAAKAAAALRPQVERRAAAEIARPASTSAEAYRLALRAATLLEAAGRAPLEAADGLARQALALDPKLALAQRVRGDVEWRRYYFGWDGDLRNLELAKQHIEGAIASDPDDPETYRLLTTMSNSPEEILEVAMRLKARGLDSAEKMAVFAEAYGQAGLFETSAELFRRTLDLDPANQTALTRMGQALEGTVEGHRYFEEAIARLGETPRLRLYLGQSRVLTGDWPGGAREYQRALDLAPDDTLIYGHLGIALEKLGRPAEASAVWSRGLGRVRQLLEDSPRNAALHGRALFLATLLRDDSAMEEAERALRAVAPSGGTDSLSLARALLGQDDEAMALALDGRSDDSELPFFLYRLPVYGLDRLANHPRYQSAMAQERARLADLIARYPID